MKQTNFDFLERGLEIVSPPPFVYDFSRKMFLILYSINWPHFIAWLPLFLEILANMCIAALSYPGLDINLEIDLIFLIKLFFYMIKKSWQKIKYIDNKILITFKGLLVAQVCLRSGYAPLRIQKINPALPNHKYHAKQQAMMKLFKPCWSQWELFLNSCNLVLNPWFHPRWYRLSLKNYVIF